MSSEEPEEVEEVAPEADPVTPVTVAESDGPDVVVVTWLHESVKFANVGDPIELERSAAWAYFRRNWCTRPPGPKPEERER